MPNDTPPRSVTPARAAIEQASGGNPAPYDQVARFCRHHTSTHPDWPTRGFDPAAVLTFKIRLMMGGAELVDEWAVRQRAKALHVGTYEAAIHNMLRRIRDQADWGSLFYLYRVHLKPSVVARKGWLPDPSNFLGDVVLDEVCPAGVDVARYLNHHEDPGGLSPALGRDPIVNLQQVTVPLPGAWDEDWVRDAVSALAAASDTVVAATGRLSRFIRPASLRPVLGRELGAALAGRLPINLQAQFASAAAFAEGDNPVRWANRTSGLLSLIDEQLRGLAALDDAEYRPV